jgi:hypothetical protein
MTERLRVAQIVTRFMAGAGGVALRGALVLDPDRYEVVFVIGSGDRLIQEAEAAGFEVVVVERLRSEIAPLDDLHVLAELTALLSAGRFDVVHTHSSKAGALGRLAAHRTEIPRIVHTFHGFPFHEFQSRLRRTAYIRVERSLGKFTDAFFQSFDTQLFPVVIWAGVHFRQLLRFAQTMPKEMKSRAEARQTARLERKQQKKR